MRTTLQKKPPKTLTWPTAVARFELAQRAKRASPETITSQLGDLKLFHTWLGEDTNPADVTLEDLREYQVGLLSGTASVSGKKLSAGSVATVTASLRRFLQFLFEEEILPSDPSARLETPKIPRGKVGSILTVPEVKRMLQAANALSPLGVRDRALVETLYHGLRRAEVYALDLADLDHAERTLTVTGKGEKTRIVPVTRTAYQALVDWVERARPVLASSHADSATALFLTATGQRLAGNTLPDVIAKLQAKASVKKRITPHTWRRSFATHLMQSGVSLRHIQLLLDHESLDTTAAYLGVNPQELRRELLLKHPRERIDA